MQNYLMIRQSHTTRHVYYNDQHLYALYILAANLGQLTGFYSDVGQLDMFH